MRAPLLALPLLLVAAQDAPKPFAVSTINVQQGGKWNARGTEIEGGAYKLVDRFDVPADHKIHDRVIALEGPGWESDKVAYRLYLDERNVPDIYGKRQPGRILDKIGMGKDDYHTLADWGMDVFQVNQSLGLGGIGVLRGGKATQLGPSTISVFVEDRDGEAGVRVNNRGFDGGAADLSTSYSIAQGSRVTRVNASASGKPPQMVAGLTLHPGVTRIDSSGKGAWRYVATWGVQSLAKDELGIALFYPAAETRAPASDGASIYVPFCNPRRISYAFAAAWVQEPDAPKTIEAFRAWLDQTAADLAAPDELLPARIC